MKVQRKWHGPDFKCHFCWLEAIIEAEDIRFDPPGFYSVECPDCHASNPVQESLIPPVHKEAAQQRYEVERSRAQADSEHIWKFLTGKGTMP